MSKRTESREQRYKRKTALALYIAGASLRQIQKELGNVTIANIRSWSVAEANKIKFPKNFRKNKNKNKKARKSKKSWKQRVFASWRDTPEQAAFRRSPEYQKWRIIVLERDKYTCQHCEATGGRLVVHHVKTFKMNPELRLEPDNGIVLCNTCHEKLHLDRVRKPEILRLAENMERTINKGCLQKLKSQTRTTDKSRPNPHLRCPEKFREWLISEEQAIDRRYRNAMY